LAISLPTSYPPPPERAASAAPPLPPPPPLKLKLSTALRLTPGAGQGPKLALAQQGITHLDTLPAHRAAAVRLVSSRRFRKS
jgi:hypothetical protein